MNKLPPEASIDISVNITAHREGLLLHRTLKSIAAQLDFAEHRGLNKIEVNIGLDNADHVTTEIAHQFARDESRVTVHQLKVGDLSLNRNFLIKHSAGRYIVFFDGDDLFTENFVYDAFRLAERQARPVVCAPSFLFNFTERGIQNPITKLKSSTDTDFYYSALFNRNSHASQNFVSREIYDRIKYQTNEGLYGAEDWHWNTRVLAAGYDILTVPDTIYFYRRKAIQKSMLAQQTAEGAVLRPTPLFKPKVFNTLNYTLSYQSIDDLISRQIVNTHDTHTNPTISDERLLNLNLYRLRRKGLLTDKMMAHWRRLNEIEPQIYLDYRRIAKISIGSYFRPGFIDDAYRQLCKDYGEIGITDLMIMPHIVPGGADMAMIRLASSLSKLGRKILVVTTEKRGSDWRHRMEEINNVYFADIRDEFYHLGEDEIGLLILRLIQHWEFQAVTVMNSMLAYNLVAKYGEILTEHTKFYFHIYCYDHNSLGQRIYHLPIDEVYPYCTQIITDSEAFRQELIETNYFNPKKLSVLPLPINESVTPITHKTKPHNKILFAGRLARQKIIDVLLEIGEDVGEQGIKLDIYGSYYDPVYLSSFSFDERVRKSKTIRYCGEYNGFDKLDLEEYDLLVMPSLFEGMPNVPLEALKANLFVVLADVGGVSEVVSHGENGFLVRDNANKAGYIQYIYEYYNRPKLHDTKRRLEVNKRLLRDHNQDVYQSNVEQIYGS